MSPAESAQPQTTPIVKSKSTGPRSEAGKQKSAMNALRHGLTGRVVVMPGEDLAAYHAFEKELFASLDPQTPVESQFAQTFIDTQWRLNRIRSIEEGMLALGHFETAGEIEVNHPEAHAAFTAARVFRADSKSFVNLGLYEQRLQRTLKESLRQLQALRTERIARRQTALDAAVSLRNLHKMKGEFYEPDRDQFVFSIAEVETEARRQLRFADVKKAEFCQFNLDRYRILSSQLAA